MEFNLEKFNPTIAELNKLADSYKDLKIDGVDDEAWYDLVKSAQKELGDKRRYIVATLKWFREEAITFQKNVIAQEKDLVAIIEGTEKDLKNKRKDIDDEKEMIKRKKALEKRKEVMEEKWLEATDDFILSLSFEEFTAWVKQQEEELLEAEKLKLAEEKAKFEKEKEDLAREKEKTQIRKEEKVAAEKKAKEVAVENKKKLADAKIKADKDKKEAVAKAEKDAEIKLKKELDDAAERVRLIATEEKRLLNEEEKKLADENKKQEWNIRYKKWLKDNDYDKMTDFVAVTDTGRTLFRKVSDFSLEEPKEKPDDDFDIWLKEKRWELPTEDLLDWFSK